MKKFIEKFNSHTKDEFLYIKLKDIVCNVNGQTIEILFIYPEQFEMQVSISKEKIENAVKKILNSELEITVNLIKSHFDKEYFIKEFLEFLDDFPSIKAQISKSDIDICEKQKKVTVSVESAIFSHCLSKNITSSIQQFLCRSYCEQINFAFTEKDCDTTIILDDVPVVTTLERDGGRIIPFVGGDVLIGKEVKPPATYISDIHLKTGEVTICGRVLSIDVVVYRKNDKDNKFYKLSIEDFTAKIGVLYFPFHKNPQSLGMLKRDDEIAIFGTIGPDKTNPQTPVMIAKYVARAKLPKEFLVNRRIRTVDTAYRTIKPKPFIEKAQNSIFDAVIKKDVCRELQEGTFVVFDIETTGLDPKLEKIVEIGAVKIKNGIFTETFSSLINPQRPIPPEATAVHGITNEDVKEKPTIDLVLPDFYKFVKDSTLVAHNLPFDIGFLELIGEKMGIYFDNEKLDTLTLARKTLAHLKKFNLPYLTKLFSITHESKHRAVDDAVAAAQLLKILLEKSVN